MRTYEGLRNKDGKAIAVVSDSEQRVTHVLSVGPSLKIADHSPTGFEWGYAGSGPAQLALAILLDFCPFEELAKGLYQQFKQDFVAKWGATWKITEFEIDDWLSAQTKEAHYASVAG